MMYFVIIPTRGTTISSWDNKALCRTPLLFSTRHPVTGISHCRATVQVLNMLIYWIIWTTRGVLDTLATWIMSGRLTGTQTLTQPSNTTNDGNCRLRDRPLRVQWTPVLCKKTHMFNTSLTCVDFLSYKAGFGLLDKQASRPPDMRIKRNSMPLVLCISI